MKTTRTMRVLLLLLALAMILPMAVACKKDGKDPQGTDSQEAEAPYAPSTPKPSSPFDAPYLEVASDASGYSGTPDTAWFTGDKTEYTLTSADQFVGFQELRGQNNSFEGVTIKLGCDVIINSGSAEEIKAKGSANYAWKDLKSDNFFKGNFDGQNHTISGVYMQLTMSAESSMFGSVAGQVSIKNFNLINSYFGAPSDEADKAIMAALVTKVTGDAELTMSNINLNIVMEEAGKKFNKMAGYVGLVSDQATIKIDNSTFAGKISITGTHVGGFIAHADTSFSTISLVTCTNYADLTTAQYCGGMIGQSKSQNAKTIDCVNRGDLNCKLNSKALTGEQIVLWDPYEGAHPAIKEGTTGIRVMTFNIQGSLPKTNGLLDNAALNRVKAVETEITYYSPDLVGLQEDNWYWHNALNLDDYLLIQDSANGSGAGSERCAIYYKKGMKLLESGTYWMTVDGTPNTAALTFADISDPNSKYYMTDVERERLQIYNDADLKRSRKTYWDENTNQFVEGTTSYPPITTRKFTYGVFEVNGQILIHVNTHLTHRSQNADYSNDELQKIRSNARLAEFDNLMEKVTKIQAKYEGSLTFFTGDFNDNKGKPIFMHVTETWGYASSESITPEHIGNKGSWNNAFNLDKQGDTYPSTSNKEGTSTGYLDYCFIQDGLSVERVTVGQGRADILDTATGAPKKIYTSDHLPVIFDLSFKTATTGKPIIPDHSAVPEEDLSKPSIYTGLPDTSWYKEGVKEFTITTADQFAGLLTLRQSSKGAITFDGVTIKLARDLIINQGTVDEYLNSGINPQVLEALNSNYAFKGVFDGQGHTISGVYLQCTTSAIKGLFGGIGDNAVIKNLTLDNCYAGGPSSEDKTALGILAGRIIGQNVVFSNIKITNCYMLEGTANFTAVGALVGRVDGGKSLTIENCEVTGLIDFATKGSKIGSLVGEVQSSATLTVKNSTSSATIKAFGVCDGFVGAVSGTTNIDNTNTFTGTITSGEAISNGLEVGIDDPNGGWSPIIKP